MKSSRLVVVLVATQVALLGVYWLVEQERSAERADQVPLGTQPPRRVNLATPALSVLRRDGSLASLRGIDQPTLVHFWATWCPPCRAELPGLLSLPSEHNVAVVAVALDDDWSDVDQFMAETPTPDVVLGEAKHVQEMLGVKDLPVTFLMLPNGQTVLRFNGERDWTDRSFVNAWLNEVEFSR